MAKKKIFYVLNQEPEFNNSQEVLTPLNIVDDDSLCEYQQDQEDVPTVVIPENNDQPQDESLVHNNLNGIQGGINGEHYHINQKEYDAIRATKQPSSINPFVTKLDLEAQQTNEIYKIEGGNAFGSNFHPSEKS